MPPVIKTCKKSTVSNLSELHILVNAYKTTVKDSFSAGNIVRVLPAYTLILWNEPSPTSSFA